MSTDWSVDPDFQYLAVDRKKLMKEQTQAFDGKKACWVPSEKEGFARAEIQSTKGEEVTVKIESNNEVLLFFIIHLIRQGLIICRQRNTLENNKEEKNVFH